jgi:hypothetical protein
LAQHLAPDFAPRALLRRSLNSVEVTPAELSLLVEVLNARTVRAVELSEQTDFADLLFCCVVELREAGR